MVGCHNVFDTSTSQDPLQWPCLLQGLGTHHGVVVAIGIGVAVLLVPLVVLLLLLQSRGFRLGHVLGTEANILSASAAGAHGPIYWLTAKEQNPAPLPTNSHHPYQWTWAP